MKIYTTVIATIFAFCVSLQAQEQLGIRTSNYGGINSLMLNPANSHTTPFSWDANLIEFGQFFDNNYGFIENFRLLNLLQNPDGVELRPLLDKDDRNAPPGSLVVDFYRSNELKKAHTLTQVMGPSLLLPLNESNTIGFFTRARATVDARKIPATLGYYEYNLQPFDESISVEPFQGSALSWSEIGLNYAHRTETDYGEISIGGSVKFLQGYESVYIRNNETFELTQLRNNSLRGTPVNFSYGFASSALKSEQWQLQRHGAGAAIDLGFVYTLGGEDEGAYRWKIGASLLDLGMIRFANAAQAHEIRTNEVQEMALDNFQNFTGPESLDSILKEVSNQLVKNPDASLQSRSFSMWLPAGLSVQAEVNVLPSFFVNATVVQGLPLGRTAVRRNSIAALTPRLETRWLELAAPITLLNWRRFRTGLYARLAFFAFGTEDFKSIFTKSNFDSTDFYIAIKLNPFNLGKREKERRSGWSGRSNKRIRARNGGVKCPSFN